MPAESRLSLSALHWSVSSILHTKGSAVVVRAIASAAVFAAASCLLAQTPTPVPVLTWRYDLTHAGQNTQETALTPANVASTSFGKLFSLPVDDHVYAQPLYVPNLKMSDGQVHNVLFVATESDSIYAFDADTKGNPIWQISLLTTAHGAASGATPVPQADVAPSQDIGPNIGITGTPAINGAANTMYVVSNTKESGQYFSRLHAINIVTGAEQPGSPVNITATVAGTGDGSSGGQVSFLPLWTNQRPALAYYNGYVYIGYASHGDLSPLHGWLFAYNASTLQQTAVRCLSPNDLGASLWGSGAGLPIDTATGKMFVVTGNGDHSQSGNVDLGESVLAFNLANGQLSLTDSFTAFNYQTLNLQDWDLGAGGLLMLPDQPGTYPHLAIAAGKEGRITLLNRDNLGGYASGASSNTNAVQDVTISAISQGQGYWGTAAYWNGNVYVWAGGENGGTPNVGMQFKLNNGVLATPANSKTTFTSAFPNPTFSISSNGTQDGILWAVRADQADSYGPAVLYAFNPDNLAQIFYESDARSSDTAGTANKFSVPVVTNGKVYFAAYGEVDVYGLLNAPQAAAAPTISPDGGSFTTAQSVTLSSATSTAQIYYTVDGSTPTTASTLYTAPITISTNTTLKAIATASGYLQSSVNSATFTFTNQAPAPTFSPAAGTYMSTQTVTLSDTDASAKIYYTTDGSTPTSASTLYSAPINVASSETIQAVAISKTMGTSNVVKAAYVIQGGTSSPAFSLSGSSVSVSAPGASGSSTVTITPSGGFTGTVALTCSIASSTSSSPTCTVTQPPAISGSQSVSATLTVATQASTSPGTYTVNVTGTSGSESESTTISAVVSQPPQTPSFTVGGTDMDIASPGASGTSTVTITPSGGFTGNVKLTCSITSSPAQAQNVPTCTVDQPPAISGSQAVTATLTVNTVAASAAVRNPMLGIGGGSALAVLLFFWLPRRRRTWQAFFGLLAFVAIVAGTSGCGTSKSLSSLPSGTTAGNYTVTVTGTSGSLQATTTIAVDVK